MLLQTLALRGPGTDALPEPRTLKLSLAVYFATAGKPHSKTDACGTDAKGAHRSHALRLIDAPVGSDAEADTSRCEPNGSASTTLALPRRSVVYENAVVLEADEKAATPSAREPEKAKAIELTRPLVVMLGAQPSEGDRKALLAGHGEHAAEPP